MWFLANFVEKKPFDLNIFLSHMKYGRKITRNHRKRLLKLINLQIKKYFVNDGWLHRRLRHKKVRRSNLSWRQFFDLDSYYGYAVILYPYYSMYGEHVSHTYILCQYGKPVFHESSWS